MHEHTHTQNPAAASYREFGGPNVRAFTYTHTHSLQFITGAETIQKHGQVNYAQMMSARARVTVDCFRCSRLSNITDIVCCLPHSRGVCVCTGVVLRLVVFNVLIPQIHTKKAHTHSLERYQNKRYKQRALSAQHDTHIDGFAGVNRSIESYAKERSPGSMFHARAEYLSRVCALDRVGGGVSCVCGECEHYSNMEYERVLKHTNACTPLDDCEPTAAEALKWRRAVRRRNTLHSTAKSASRARARTIALPGAQVFTITRIHSHKRSACHNII